MSCLHSEKARLRRGAPLHALFVHVPPAAAVPLPRQLAFLRDLLQAIAQQLAPAADADGAAAASEEAAADAAEQLAGAHLGSAVAGAAAGAAAADGLAAAGPLKAAVVEGAALAL